MTRNRFYLFLTGACLLGYAWVVLLHISGIEKSEELRVCIFRYFTSIACPACGSSRSVLCLFDGDFSSALTWNPFGFIIFPVLIFSPVWLIIDLLLNRSSLFNFYHYIERIFKKKYVAIPAIILVLLNWFWNIKKGF